MPRWRKSAQKKYDRKKSQHFSRRGVPASGGGKKKNPSRKVAKRKSTSEPDEERRTPEWREIPIHLSRPSQPHSCATGQSAPGGGAFVRGERALKGTKGGGKQQTGIQKEEKFRKIHSTREGSSRAMGPRFYIKGTLGRIIHIKARGEMTIVKTVSLC